MVCTGHKQVVGAGIRPAFFIFLVCALTGSVCVSAQLSDADLALTLDADILLSYSTYVAPDVTKHSQLDAEHYASFDQTSNYLLSMCGYNGLSYLDEQGLYDLQVTQNVHALGFGNVLSTIMPSSEDDKIACCATSDLLQEHINSGAACTNFKSRNWDSRGVWSTDKWFDTTRDNGNLIRPFIYLKDACDYEPLTSHCKAKQSEGGTPDLYSDENVRWWQLLFQGFVNCSYQLSASLGDKSQLADFKWHMWNEPNAKFWEVDEGGDYYVAFYEAVIGNLKSIFNEDNDEFGNIGMKVGGPVTWNNPTWKDVWEDYYVPLMKMNHETLYNGLNDGVLLLDSFDFHAYTDLAYWDVIATCINALNVYNWIYNEFNIRSDLTETSMFFDAVWMWQDAYTHWTQRPLFNAQQVILLSHFPNKLDQRHLFDLNATSKGYFTYWGTNEEYSQQVLGQIQNNRIVKYSLTDTSSNSVKVGDPFFYDTDLEVITSTVYDEEKNLLFIYFVNNATSEITVDVTDSANLVTFQTSTGSTDDDNMFARFFGVYNSLTVASFTGGVRVTLKPQSVTQLVGTLSSAPSTENKRIEYNCDSLDSVMSAIYMHNRFDDIALSCNIDVSQISSDSEVTGMTAVGAYIRVGLVGVGASVYDWDITATLGASGRDDISYNAQLGASALQYREIWIDSDEFLQYVGQSDSLLMSISGTGTQAAWGWDTKPTGRFGFISLVVEWESTSYLDLILSLLGKIAASSSNRESGSGSDDQTVGSSDGNKGNDSGTSTGVVVGSVIGALLGLVLIGGGVYLFRKSRNAKKQGVEESDRYVQFESM